MFNSQNDFSFAQGGGRSRAIQPLGGASLFKWQLAQLYFPGLSPKQAAQNLRRSIARCPALVEELDKVHYSVTSKRLTLPQVEAICRYLGRP